jgi:arsenite-transporting ATPase
LVVENLVMPPDQVAPFAQARRNMQVKYLAEIRERFDTPVLEIPLLPQEVKGLEMLAKLSELAYGEQVTA